MLDRLEPQTSQLSVALFSSFLKAMVLLFICFKVLEVSQGWVGFLSLICFCGMCFDSRIWTQTLITMCHPVCIPEFKI